MNRIIATIVLWSLLICAIPFPAVVVHAQATPARINIVASGSIADLGGAPIVTGKLFVLATNDHDAPVAVNVGGVQQGIAQQIERPISNGSLASALSLPNPVVSTPSPLRYRITIRNDDVKPSSITVYRNVDVEDDGTGNWDLGHYLTGATANPAAGVTLQTNGAANTNQALLNLKPGAHITLTADTAGGVTIAGDGSGSGGTSITWQGAYASGSTYALNDAVSYNGSSYISRQANNTGHQPDTSSSWWGLLASKGDTGAAGAAGATGREQ